MKGPRAWAHVRKESVLFCSVAASAHCEHKCAVALHALICEVSVNLQLHIFVKAQPMKEGHRVSICRTSSAIQQSKTKFVSPADFASNHHSDPDPSCCLTPEQYDAVSNTSRNSRHTCCCHVVEKSASRDRTANQISWMCLRGMDNTA